MMGMGERNCVGLARQGGRLVAVLATRHGRRVTTSPVNVDGRPLPEGIPPVVALPTARSITRWFETPFSTRTRAEAVLPTLLDVQLPFPLETCRYTCVAAVQQATGTRLLAAAARQTDLTTELNAWKTQGVDPVVVDCEPLALWSQALGEHPPVMGQLRCIVQLGGDAMSLVVGRGTDYLAGYSIRRDDWEQVQRYLEVHTTDGQAEWLLGGSGAESAETVAMLRARWGHVTVLAEPALFLCRALATRALLGGILACNLRVGEDAHPMWSARERSQRLIPASLLAVAGLILILASLATHLTLKHQSNRLDGEFKRRAEALAGAAMGAAKGEQALRWVESAMAGRKAELAPFLLRVGTPAHENLAVLLETAAGSSIRIDEARLASPELYVRGGCADMAAAGFLAQRLNDCGANVVVRELSMLPDGIRGFELAAAGVGP